MAIGRYLRKAICFPVLALILTTLTAFHPPAGHAYELLIGTGESGSFSHFAGKTLCRAINKADNNLTCRPVPSVNDTDSLTNVLNGSLDMALANSKILYDAFNRAGYFQYVTLDYDQLRLLTPFYHTPISLAVRRDAKIRSLANLSGKKVNGGAPLSLEDIVFREVMAAQGWQAKDFRLFQNLSAVNAQDYIALHGGSVQAMPHIGMHPDRKLKSSLAKGKTDLVGINGASIRELIDANVGFSYQSIPPDIYPEVPEKVETLALTTLLITSADTDDETVNQILESIFAAKRSLQYAHPAFLQVRTDMRSLNENYLHPHPASILFFQVNN